jgi:hypothetical protein
MFLSWASLIQYIISQYIPLSYVSVIPSLPHLDVPSELPPSTFPFQISYLFCSPNIPAILPIFIFLCCLFYDAANIKNISSRTTGRRMILVKVFYRNYGWKNWRKPWKISARSDGVTAEFQTTISCRVQVKTSFNWTSDHSVLLHDLVTVITVGGECMLRNF